MRCCHVQAFRPNGAAAASISAVPRTVTTSVLAPPRIARRVLNPNHQPACEVFRASCFGDPSGRQRGPAAASRRGAEPSAHLAGTLAGTTLLLPRGPAGLPCVRSPCSPQLAASQGAASHVPVLCPWDLLLPRR